VSITLIVYVPDMKLSYCYWSVTQFCISGNYLYRLAEMICCMCYGQIVRYLSITHLTLCSPLRPPSSPVNWALTFHLWGREWGVYPRSPRLKISICLRCLMICINETWRHNTVDVDDSPLGCSINWMLSDKYSEGKQLLMIILL